MKPHRRTSRATAAWISVPRGFLLAVTLLSFILQGFITQTHIHSAQFSAQFGFGGFLTKLSSAGDADAAAKTHGDKAPVKDGETKCPFCQAGLQAGAFLTPSAISLLLPTETYSLLPLILARFVHVETASHAWHGRAPPQV
jgi:hypothetical protein